MHSGLLTGAMTKERVANLPPDDFRRNAKNYQEPLLSRNLAIADFLKQIGARHGVSAGVIAIAWTLANPAITGGHCGRAQPGAGGGRLAGRQVPPLQGRGAGDQRLPGRSSRSPTAASDLTRSAWKLRLCSRRLMSAGRVRSVCWLPFPA